jgi:hypothetical protein
MDAAGARTACFVEITDADRAGVLVPVVAAVAGSVIAATRTAAPIVALVIAAARVLNESMSSPFVA